MSFIQQAAASKERIQSEYFSPGEFRVRINNFTLGQNRHGDEFVVLETEILESSTPDTNPVGSERSWLQMTRKDMTGPNIKGFIARLLSVKDSTTTEEWETIIKNALATPSPLIGYEVSVTAKEITTRSGNPFTVLDWKGPGQPPVS
tara:strand:- start:513 stop:953 length:441 start_codon:yes stop_codon:yes gene_type:complete